MGIVSTHYSGEKMSNLIKSVVAINAKSTKDAEEFIDRVSGSSFFPRDNREDAEVFDFARIVPLLVGAAKTMIVTILWV